VARVAAQPDSDIDIMIEVDPEAHLTVHDYVGFKEFVAILFDGRVDKPRRPEAYVRPAATADAIYAF
jgi:uncharacterized protein